MRKLIIGLFCCLFLLGGCATRPTDPDELVIYQQNNDPLEPMNRGIFAFNQKAEAYVFEPAVKGYRAVVPSPVRTGFDNFLANLRQPIYFVNAVLQGDMKAAATITGRFTVNSLLGFFGLFDTASKLDIPVVKRDFGQTLAVWGVKDSGPYLMLPLLGPTTLRDAVGLGVDTVGDPVDWIIYNQNAWLSYARTGAGAFLKYENMHDLTDSMEKGSTDYYATMRSMYQQNRQKEVSALRGEKMEAPAEYEFDFPDDEEE